MVKVTESGATVMSEDLLKVASGSYEVSVIFQLNLSHLAIDRIRALGNCSMLTTLDLSHNRITSLGVAAVGAANAGNPRKKSTGAAPQGSFVTHSAIAPPDGAAAELEGLLPVADTLIHLNLSFNALEDISLLTQFRRLQTLQLQGNRIASLENVTPIGTVGTLRTLQLQAFDLKSDQNPCCASVSREEYCKIMARAFPTVRCLDGHYFCKDEVDPSLGCLIGQDFEVQIPESTPWFSEKALQALSTNVMDATKCGIMTEKAVLNAVADAKKTVETARRSFGV